MYLGPRPITRNRVQSLQGKKKFLKISYLTVKLKKHFNLNKDKKFLKVVSSFKKSVLSGAGAAFKFRLQFHSEKGWLRCGNTDYF